MSIKIKKQKKLSIGDVVALTDIKTLGCDQVEIHHHQSFKQVINYNSAETGYGLTVKTSNDVRDINHAIKKMEAMIEDLIVAKFTEQQKVLQRL